MMSEKIICLGFRDGREGRLPQWPLNKAYKTAYNQGIVAREKRFKIKLEVLK